MPSQEPVAAGCQNAWNVSANHGKTRRLVKKQREKQAERKAAGQGWGDA